MNTASARPLLLLEGAHAFQSNSPCEASKCSFLILCGTIPFGIPLGYDQVIFIYLLYLK